MNSYTLSVSQHWGELPWQEELFVLEDDEVWAHCPAEHNYHANTTSFLARETVRTKFLILQILSHCHLQLKVFMRIIAGVFWPCHMNLRRISRNGTKMIANTMRWLLTSTYHSYLALPQLGYIGPLLQWWSLTIWRAFSKFRASQTICGLNTKEPNGKQKQ